MTYTPTPEAVEAAARASYESFMARMTRHFAEHGVTLPPARPWEEVSDVDHETFREDATAALTAAGPHIAQVKAEGWDEGARAGLDVGLSIAEKVHANGGTLNLAFIPNAPVNPYRKEADRD